MWQSLAAVELVWENKTIVLQNLKIIISDWLIDWLVTFLVVHTVGSVSKFEGQLTGLYFVNILD